jgi:hypothetical protein
MLYDFTLFQKIAATGGIFPVCHHAATMPEPAATTIEVTMPLLDKWDSFFVIIGSAAGALIGLQFVVMTLIAERPPLRAADAGAAFATPTIVHFSVVLALAALLRAPWDSVFPVAVICGFIGIAGIVYVLITARRMRLQTTYKPDIEDRLFHIVVPLAAYVTLAASACAALRYLREALFGIAGASLLMLFGSIHNAWDAVAYHVLVSRPSRDSGKA